MLTTWKQILERAVKKVEQAKILHNFMMLKKAIPQQIGYMI